MKIVSSGCLHISLRMFTYSLGMKNIILIVSLFQIALYRLPIRGKGPEVVVEKVEEKLKKNTELWAHNNQNVFKRSGSLL